MNSKRAGSLADARASVDAFRRDSRVAGIPEMLSFMNTQTNWRDGIAESR